MLSSRAQGGLAEREFSVTPTRLDELLNWFQELRVLVLGDFILELLLEINPAEESSSLNTGRRVHQIDDVQRTVSAAGTVTGILGDLGIGTRHVMGLVGDDADGREIVRLLREQGCHADGLSCHPEITTPLSVRPFDRLAGGMTGRYPRYDRVVQQPTPTRLVSLIAGALDHILPAVDAVIVLDESTTRDYGTVTSVLRDLLAEQAQRHPRVLFWADSRRYVRQFRNMIIKPNQFEAVGRTHALPGDEIPLADLYAVVPRIRQETEAPVFVSCGNHGMLTSDPALTLVPPVPLQGSINPHGAGDAATAGAVAALCAGATFPEAALFANLVASRAVQGIDHPGSVSSESIHEALRDWLAVHEFAAAG